MDFLPVEIQHNILGHIDAAKDIHRCMRVCRHWYDVLRYLNLQYKCKILASSHRFLSDRFVYLKRKYYEINHKPRYMAELLGEISQLTNIHILYRLTLSINYIGMQKPLYAYIYSCECEIAKMLSTTWGCVAMVARCDSDECIRIMCNKSIFTIHKRHIICTRGLAGAIQYRRSAIMANFSNLLMQTDINMTVAEFIEKTYTIVDVYL